MQGVSQIAHKILFLFLLCYWKLFFFGFSIIRSVYYKKKTGFLERPPRSPDFKTVGLCLYRYFKPFDFIDHIIILNELEGNIWTEYGTIIWSAGGQSFD